MSYTYSVARIRALETTLLSKQEVEKLLDSDNPDSIIQTLENVNYGGTSGDKKNIEEFITKELDSALKTVELLTPQKDRDIINLFRLRYDYHNLKVLTLAQLLRKKLSGTIPLGVYPLEELESSMPSALMTEILSLKEDIKPEEITNTIEKQRWTHFLNVSKRNKFVLDLFRKNIDLINLKSFIQNKFLQVDKTGFEVQLIDNGRLDRSIFLDYYDQPFETFFKYLSFTDYGIFKDVPVEDNLWSIEKIVDEYIGEYLSDRTKLVFFDIGPLINYIYLKEGEARTLRTVWVGKKNNLPKEKIKSYLRKSYV